MKLFNHGLRFGFKWFWKYEVLEIPKQIKRIFENRKRIKQQEKWLFERMLGAEHQALIDTVPWDAFFYPAGYLSFIELLLDLEGKKELAGGCWYSHYTALSSPSKYITNCCHPTIEGYSVIAKEIFNHLKRKDLV
jgi:hypothetical protein